MDRLEQFLVELEKLTEKYKIQISCCGCCPGVIDIEKDAIASQELHYEDGKYEVDKNTYVW